MKRSQFRFGGKQIFKQAKKEDVKQLIRI